MLELRPTCENCNKPLKPESTDAMICTFECTFCRACVNALANVCPNCGGGFASRPQRPVANWKGDNFLGRYPASAVVKHRPVDLGTHGAFAAQLKERPPHQR